MTLLTVPDQDIRDCVLAFARCLDINDERAVATALARATDSGTQRDAEETISEACGFLHSWHRHPSNARLRVR